jgi:superfamily II DNA or RNA helicase
MASINEVLVKLKTFENEKKKGDYFEDLVVWYLQNSPIYRDRIKKVTKFYDWPDRWKGVEAGVDIIAETIDGELWAIQAKGYQKTTHLKLEDVQSWLTDSNRKIFSHRILIGTFGSLSKNSIQKINGQEKSASWRLFSDLFSEDLDWPIYEKEITKNKSLTPYPHQKRAINDVVSSFTKDCDKGKLIMACGSGKTLTSLWIDERMKNNLTVCFFPSLTLLAKTMLEWSKNRTEKFVSLPVCSDSSITKNQELEFYSGSLGIPSTTEPDHIKNFLSIEGRKVIFCTYQSSKILVDTLNELNIVTDIGIFDEAHRTVGVTDREYSYAATSKFKARKKLFMTATPVYIARRAKEKLQSLDFESISMDDELIYGKDLHRLGFGKAISEDILSDYELKILEVDSNHVKEILYKYPELSILKKKWPTYNIASLIALKLAYKESKFKRFISFHNSIVSARTFASTFTEIAQEIDFEINNFLFAEHLNGKQSAAHRIQKLDKLNNISDEEYGFITNARCLSEGIDVPELDGVIIVEPRSSKTDIIQIVGRAMRKKKRSNKKGTILLPLVLDRDSNSEEQIQEDAFRQVVDVIRSLISHDDRLDLLIKKVILKKGRSNFTFKDLEPHISIKLSSTLSKSMMDTIILRSVVDPKKNWFLTFKDLEKFILEHKRMPKSHQSEIGNESSLNSWAARQRGIFRGTFEDESLTSEQVKLLDSLKPHWFWEKELPLEKFLPDLRKYLIENNHLSIVGRNNSLEHWVGSIRATYNSGEILENGDRVRFTGKNNTRLILTKKDIETVENLHWTWSWHVYDFVWKMNFNLLKLYLNNENTINVPMDLRINPPINMKWSIPYGSPLFNLNGWITRQRTEYAYKTGKRDLRADKKRSNYISDDKISLLKNLDKNILNNKEKNPRYINKFIYEDLICENFEWKFSRNKNINKISLKWGTDEYWKSYDFRKDESYKIVKKYVLLNKTWSDASLMELKDEVLDLKSRLQIYKGLLVRDGVLIRMGEYPQYRYKMR